MRKGHIITVLAATSVVVATTNLSGQNQENPASQQERHANTPVEGSVHPGDREQADALSRPAQTGYTNQVAVQSRLKASQIIGHEVRGDQGERLGKVKDLIVSLDSEMAPFAIIEYGGTLGIGETRVAVPLAELKWSGDTKQFSMSVGKEQFLSASSVPAGGWGPVANEEWAKTIDRFYGDPASLGHRFERQTLPGERGGREFLRAPAGKELVPPAMERPAEDQGNDKSAKPGQSNP